MEFLSSFLRRHFAEEIEVRREISAVFSGKHGYRLINSRFCWLGQQKQGYTTIYFLLIPGDTVNDQLRQPFLIYFRALYDLTRSSGKQREGEKSQSFNLVCFWEFIMIYCRAIGSET